MAGACAAGAGGGGAAAGVGAGGAAGFGAAGEPRHGSARRGRGRRRRSVRRRRGLGRERGFRRLHRRSGLAHRVLQAAGETRGFRRAVFAGGDGRGAGRGRNGRRDSRRGKRRLHRPHAFDARRLRALRLDPGRFRFRRLLADGLGTGRLPRRGRQRLQLDPLRLDLGRRHAARRRADDGGLDKHVIRPADHDEMLDIVAAHQQQLALAVDIEHLDDPEPGLPAPAAAADHGARRPARDQPENVGQQQQQDENDRKCNCVLHIGRHAVAKKPVHEFSTPLGERPRHNTAFHSPHPP